MPHRNLPPLPSLASELISLKHAGILYFNSVFLILVFFVGFLFPENHIETFLNGQTILKECLALSSYLFLVIEPAAFLCEGVCPVMFVSR